MRPHLPTPRIWDSSQVNEYPLAQAGARMGKKQTSNLTESCCSTLLKLWTLSHWKGDLGFMLKKATCTWSYSHLCRQISDELKFHAKYVCVAKQYYMRPTFKIHRYSAHNILPVCGGNEENVRFLTESLGGVTQQEDWSKESRGCGRWLVPGPNHLCKIMTA